MFDRYEGIKTGWAESMDACVIELMKMGSPDIQLGINFNDDINLTQVSFANLESICADEIADRNEEIADAKYAEEHKDDEEIDEIRGALWAQGYILPSNHVCWTLSDARYYDENAEIALEHKSDDNWYFD